MQKRPLGTGGPEIGAIGLGCMSFGGIYGATDEAESQAALAAAIDLGIDHLDTADIYGGGVSEEIIGRFLKTRSNRFTIASKAGITRQKDKPFDNSAAYLRTCLEASLTRLGVDHIDLYYIHRRDQSVPIEDVVGTLVRFKEEGKIGAIGFSEIAPSSLERAHAVHPIAAVQAEYSLWTRLPELGMVQACARLGTALVAFSPLARGMLTSAIPDAPSLPDTDFRHNNPRFVEPNLSYNLKAVRRFADHAREVGYSPEALAIAWVLHRGPHIIPIPGTRSARHLASDAEAASIVLTQADTDAIESILPAGFAHGERYNPTQARGPESYS